MIQKQASTIKPTHYTVIFIVLSSLIIAPLHALYAIPTALKKHSVSYDLINGSCSTYLNTKFDPDSVADCKVVDARDLIKKVFNKQKQQGPIKHRKFSTLILPDFSINPTNGILFGLSTTTTWFNGLEENTKISKMKFNIAYTTKKQVITSIKSAIFTNENKYYLEGDWHFSIFAAPTFGLGTNSPDTTYNQHFVWQAQDVGVASGSYPMKYKFGIFHQTINRKFRNNMFAGIGYHFLSYWDIEDERLDLDAGISGLTPHWLHSKTNNFDTSHYALSGPSINMLFDSRDNQLNPYKGIFLRLNYRFYLESLGSARNASTFWAEFRAYASMSKRIPKKVLAFWLFGNFLTTGQIPYFTLPALGGDQDGRSGRGYIQARYRGEQLMYAEIEYRFPIIPCYHTLGAVIFANFVSATNLDRNVQLFDYIRPAVGFGIHLLFNKGSRLTLNIDYAVGHKSNGIYFSGAEAF